jgi:AraC-like DNA-binding protein
LLIRFLLDIVASAHDGRQLVYSETIRLAMDYIEVSSDRVLPLSDVAQRARLSLPRFKSKFKHEVGIPPADYILRGKIARATQWLRDTDKSVTDIAMRLGFPSSQYFATVFRRYTRHSPRQARTVRVFLS